MAFGVLPKPAQALELSLDDVCSFLGLLLRPGKDQKVIQTGQDAQPQMPLVHGARLARSLRKVLAGQRARMPQC